MPLTDAKAKRGWLDVLEHARADRRARRSRQLWRMVILVLVSTSAIVATIAVYGVAAKSRWFETLPAQTSEH
jgi:hypothetical protein